MGIRKDCEIDDIPVSIPANLGSNPKAVRGDLIRWKTGGWTEIGRVIGRVTAHDLPKPYLCVAMLFHDIVTEQWVDPDTVVFCQSATQENGSFPMIQWLTSAEFMTTPVDIARDCFNHLVEWSWSMSASDFFASATTSAAKQQPKPTVINDCDLT